MQILKTNLHIVHEAVVEAHSADAKTSKENMFTEAHAFLAVLFGSTPHPPSPPTLLCLYMALAG
jgi:hypothetical protein